MRANCSEILDRLSIVLPHLKHRFVPGQSLRDFAFDSLDLVELLCVIESEFAVRLSEDELSSAATVGELASFISMHRELQP
jgi:acyl carrier protein